jgi:hypothetical protein
MKHLPHNSLVCEGFPGVNLIKLFWRKFTHAFCKLDHFKNESNICCIAMKRFSLQQIVSKFTPKEFYEIGPSNKH